MPSEGTAFVATGATTGAWVSLNIGGMGLAFSGTAVGLGLAPVTATGAIAGAASYGIFSAVVEGDASAISAAALGGLGGAGVSMSIGGMGLSFSGTAISLGIAPVTVAGSVVGLAVYGLLKVLDASGSKETANQVFSRMEEKVSWNEAYQQALLELDLETLERNLLSGPVKQKFAAWEIDAELKELRTQVEQKSFSATAVQQQLLLLASQAFSVSELDLQFTELTNVSIDASQSKPIETSQKEEKATTVAIQNTEAQPSHVWNHMQTLRREHSAAINSVAFSPDSQVLATGSSDRTVCLWNLQAGKQFFRFVGQAREVHSVAISPDGKILASASFDQKVTAWKLESKDLLRTFLYLTNTYSHRGFVYAVEFSPDSKMLISAGADHAIRAWHLETGRLSRSFNGHSDQVLSIAISSDGKILVSGSADHTIRIWNLSRGETIHTLCGHTNWVFSVAISSDSQIFASGSTDGTIRLWNLQTGNLLNILTGHTAGVFSVAISPDGQTLASGSNDGTVRLWNLISGELLQTLVGQHPVAFSPDGRTLVSGGSQGSIKIWYQGAQESRLATEIVLPGQWWEVLEVDKTADLEVVRQSYRRLARLHHPDTNSDAKATASMQVLNKAYREFRTRPNSQYLR
jgi:DnaJ domain/WD domain, G-beta repeat